MPCITVLEPSSDSRTWSVTVTSPASEQSATSSPLQTSSTLYSKTQNCAIPFLKFFSVFLNFFSPAQLVRPFQKILMSQAFSRPHFFVISLMYLSTVPGVSFNISMHTPPGVSHLSPSSTFPNSASLSGPFLSPCTIILFEFYSCLLVYKYCTFALYHFKAFLLFFENSLLRADFPSARKAGAPLKHIRKTPARFMLFFFISRHFSVRTRLRANIRLISGSPSSHRPACSSRSGTPDG